MYLLSDDEQTLRRGEEEGIHTYVCVLTDCSKTISTKIQVPPGYEPALWRENKQQTKCQNWTTEVICCKVVHILSDDNQAASNAEVVEEAVRNILHMSNLAIDIHLQSAWWSARSKRKQMKEDVITAYKSVPMQCTYILLMCKEEIREWEMKDDGLLQTLCPYWFAYLLMK